MCEHAGFWTCEARYDRDDRMLRFLMRCDSCGERTRDLGEQGYEPLPDAVRAVRIEPGTVAA